MVVVVGTYIYIVDREIFMLQIIRVKIFCVVKFLRFRLIHDCNLPRGVWTCTQAIIHRRIFYFLRVVAHGKHSGN